MGWVMRGTAFFSPIALMLAVSGSAAAMQAPPVEAPSAEPDGIVITGKLIPEPAAVTRFVRNVATPVAGQLAVFRQPVCPNVLGFAPEDAAKVLDRMRVVARSAGVPFASGSCHPNLTLIVAADGRAFMHEVERTRGRTLQALSGDERQRLIDGPGPAWAWRTIGVRTAEGKPNQVNDPSLIMGGGSMGGTMTGMQTRGASIMKLQVRQDVGDAYVVIDERYLGGKSAIQIADYMMMRAVAGAQPSPGQSSSILSLFDAGAEPPQSLSYLDLAFLTTVYELPMDRDFNWQLSTIAARINGSDTSRKANQDLGRTTKE